MLVEILLLCWYRPTLCSFGMLNEAQKLLGVHSMRQSHTWSLILLILHFLSVSFITIIIVYVTIWFAVVFGINSANNAGRKTVIV